MIRKFSAALAVATVGCVLSSASQAATATYYFNWNNINAPTQTYATLTLTDVGTGVVKFVLDANNALPFFSGTTPVFKGFGFNADPNQTLAEANFAFSLTECNTSCGSYGYDGSGNQNGFGSFEHNVKAAGGNQNARDPLVFTVTKAGTDIRTYAQTNADGYLFGAHVVGDGLGDTFFIAAKPGDDYTVVPLPATVWLLGSAILGLLGIGRRRSGIAAA